MQTNVTKQSFGDFQAEIEYFLFIYTSIWNITS